MKDTIEGLEKKLKKAEKTRKIMRQSVSDAFSKAWDLKYGNDRLAYFIKETKITLGGYKGHSCPALGKHEVGSSWKRTRFTCLARERKFDVFKSPQDVYRNLCYSCKWTREQIITRKVMIRLKGKRNE